MLRDTILRYVPTVLAAVVLQAELAQRQLLPAIISRAPESIWFIGPKQDSPLSVPLATIEDNPDPFLGREVSVDGEVEEILGPRVFTIDEPNWADFDDEVMVIMPAERFAPVHTGDRISVTGRLFSAAEPALAEASAQINYRRDDLADRSVILAVCVTSMRDAQVLRNRSAAISAVLPCHTSRVGRSEANTLEPLEKTSGAAFDRMLLDTIVEHEQDALAIT